MLPRNTSLRVGLRKLLIVGGSVLLLLMFASALWDMRRLRNHIVTDIQGDLANLASALAGETAESINKVDFLLHDVAEQARRGLSTVTPSLLRDKLAVVSGVDTLTVFDAAGRVQAYASIAAPEAASPPSWSAFASIDAAPGSDFYIGPAPAAASDRRGMIIARRIAGEGGRPLAVVMATLRPSHFENFYKAIHLPQGGLVNLYRADGTLLARYPEHSGPAATSLSQVEAFKQALARGKAICLEVVHPADGEERLIGLEPVARLPLMVGVGAGKHAALAPWRQQAGHVLARTLVLCTAMAGLVLVLLRELRLRDSADARVRESEERYALAMAGSNEGHWDWDITNGKLYLSSRLMHLLGRDDGDLVTDDAWIKHGSLVHAEDAARYRQALLNHLRGRAPQYECEYRVMGSDGELRWLLDRGVGLRDSHGTMYRMAGAVIDVTEHRLAEAERGRLEQRLRQAEKLEALGTMAGGIAHDFNNILGAILGYGDMAQNATTEGTSLKRHIGNVMTAANRAKALVDQILTYSRSQRGPRSPIEVSALVEETLELVRASLPSGIALEVANRVGKVEVICDPTHVHQIVMNLCTNAIHAMGEGGRLQVRLDALESASTRSLSHGALAIGRYLRLTVEDSGTGMSVEVLARLFEPFFTTKQPGAGTGLGLPLVQGIVTDLGGAVHVVSAPGKGTTFEIYLPRYDGVSESVSPAQSACARGEGQRVLLVEDEKPLLLLGEEMLAGLGYEPAGFSSASAALAALAEDPAQFDAVITDYIMPGMTGIELTQRVRERRPDLPVILVSGYRGPVLDQEAGGAGVQQTLTKPLQPHELAQALARALSTDT